MADVTAADTRSMYASDPSDALRPRDGPESMLSWIVHLATHRKPEGVGRPLHDGKEASEAVGGIAHRGLAAQSSCSRPLPDVTRAKDRADRDLLRWESQ